MMKLTGICALILTYALAGVAQERQKNESVRSKPDLSGAWMLDRNKSNVRKSGKAPSKPEEPLKITHREPELKINRTLNLNGQNVRRDLIYYTDERGETNPTTMFLTDGRQDIDTADGHKNVTQSNTRWSGNKLVTRSILRNLLGGHLIEYELIDEWKLSSDGKALTQTTRLVFKQDPMSRSIYVPSGAPDIKRVYSRLPD